MWSKEKQIDVWLNMYLGGKSIEFLPLDSKRNLWNTFKKLFLLKLELVSTTLSQRALTNISIKPV